MRAIKELLKVAEWDMTDDEFDALEAWKDERRREEQEYEQECRGDYDAYDEYESHGRVLYY